MTITLQAACQIRRLAYRRGFTTVCYQKGLSRHEIESDAGVSFRHTPRNPNYPDVHHAKRRTRPQPARHSRPGRAGPLHARHRPHLGARPARRAADRQRLRRSAARADRPPGAGGGARAAVAHRLCRGRPRCRGSPAPAPGRELLRRLRGRTAGARAGRLRLVAGRAPARGAGKRRLRGRVSGARFAGGQRPRRRLRHQPGAGVLDANRLRQRLCQRLCRAADPDARGGMPRHGPRGLPPDRQAARRVADRGAGHPLLPARIVREPLRRPRGRRKRRRGRHLGRFRRRHAPAAQGRGQPRHAAVRGRNRRRQGSVRAPGASHERAAATSRSSPSTAPRCPRR